MPETATGAQLHLMGSCFAQSRTRLQQHACSCHGAMHARAMVPCAGLWDGTDSMHRPHVLAHSQIGPCKGTAAPVQRSMAHSTCVDSCMGARAVSGGMQSNAPAPRTWLVRCIWMGMICIISIHMQGMHLQHVQEAVVDRGGGQVSIADAGLRSAGIHLYSGHQSQPYQIDSTSLPSSKGRITAETTSVSAKNAPRVSGTAP